MRHTVVFTLKGTPAQAVAVEWTDQAAPQGSAAGWEACLRLADGSWRLAGHGAEATAHWREPGPFAGLALRYRLSPAGPWSPISAERKEIVLVAVEDPGAVPPALAAADWSIPEPVALDGGGLTGAVRLSGPGAGAAAVEWTDGESGIWEACLPHDAADRWRFARYGADEAAGLDLRAARTAIGLRYRRLAGGAWSPVSADRKALAAADDGGSVPPVLLLAPVLMGTGRIGTEHSVTPGLWGGLPLPQTAFQWLRDGAEIPAATRTVYVPGAEDDRRALSCRVTAASSAGSRAVETASVAVTHAAPETVGTMPEEILDAAPGAVAEIAAAPYFAGEALEFAVTGAGAQIDPATGVIRLALDAPLGGAVVTVTAANSGGMVTQAFAVTIEADEVEEAPPALAAAEWQVEGLRDPILAGAPLVGMIRILSGPALEATAVYRTGFDPTDGYYPGFGFELCIRHPDAAQFPNCWLWRSNNPAATRHIVTDRIGADVPLVLRYTRDAAEIPLEEALFSADSDRKIWRVQDTVLPEPEPETPAGTPAVRSMPIYTKAEFDAASLPGDHGQYMLAVAQCQAEPNVFFMAQDMGGVWATLDHGRTWNTLRNRGLQSRFMVGLACDPLDRRRLFGITGAGGRWDDGQTPPGSLEDMGLYRSTDGGLTWTRAIPNTVNIGRGRFNTICHAPSSATAARGHAARWYCILQKPPGNHELWMTDDAGETWRRVRELSHATYGTPGRLVGHPTDPDVVFMYGGNGGLWRFDDAPRAAGSITRLSGLGGLPAGGVAGTIYVSPDGQVLIVGVSGKGVYRSTDGGAKWSQRSAEGRSLNLFVNPWNPDRMVMMFGKNDGQLRYSKDGGATFADAARSAQVPGEGGGDALIDENYGHAQWLPGDPDRIWVHGRARNHQSDDGGVSWRPSNAYFNGKQFTNWFTDQMFDPANPDRFAYFMVDFGCALTTNRGRWFTRAGLRAGQLGLRHSTVNGGALHPDASRRTLLLSMGKANAGALCLSRDDGETWTLPMGTTERRYQYIGFDLSDPRYAYANRYRSTDHGVSWSVMPGLPSGWTMWGMTFGAANGSDGQVLFAVDIDITHSRLMRSRDRGASWQLVLETPFGFGLPVSKGGPFRCHPTDPDVVFAKGAGGQMLRRWDLSRGTPSSRPFTDFDVTAGLGGAAPGGGFELSALGIDRRFPEVIYAMNGVDNTAVKLVGTRDGGKTWRNLTAGFPATQHGGLEVSPVTGEVFLSGGNGTRAMQPVYAVAGAGQALAVWPQRHLERPY